MMMCHRSVPLILTLGTWFVIGLVPATGSAQQVKSDLLRADDLFRRAAWSEAEEIYSRTLAESPIAATPEKERQRRLCLSRLTEIHRRLGHYKEALDFALEERDLQRLQRGPDSSDNLQRSALVVAECRAALSNYSEARAVLQDLLDDRFGPAKGFPKFQALVELAIVDQLTDHADNAVAHWREADQMGRRLWSQFQKSLSPDDSTVLLQRLLECQEALGDEDARRQFLETLLSQSSQSPAATARSVRICLELGTRAALRQDFPHAEEHLREALRRINADESPRMEAQAHQLLAQLLVQQKREAEARAEQVFVVDRLERLVNDSQAGATTRLADLKQLRGLYLTLNRTREAVNIAERLLERQAAELGTDHPQTIESRAMLGSLYGSLNQYAKAKPLLDEVVVAARKSGRSPTVLARGLNNLGAVERGVGELAAARLHFNEALKLRSLHLPPDHPDLATSYNNLASVYLAQGQFKDAIQLYNQVRELCEKRGVVADDLLGVTLLNLAMAHKAQGQLPEAAALCEQSLKLLEKVQGSGTMTAVGHYNALATLARAQGRIPEAIDWANKTLSVCKGHQQEQDLAVASACVQLGMIACLAKKYELADDHWQRALKIQREQRQPAQVSATLNLLGVLACQRERYDEAQAFLEEAERRQRETESTPQDRYNVLCNLAAVHRHEQHNQLAFDLLRQALAIPEAIRSETFGEAELGRAKFLAQFASAFEMRVQWSLEDGDLNEAFLAAEQSRNRTFLDQLNLAGVDLQSTLPDEAKSRLLPREEELRVELRRLGQQARLLSEQPDSSAEMTLVSNQRRAAEAKYAQLLNELRDSSPVYKRLLTQDQKIPSLDQLREQLGSETLCLFYHLGSQRSVVLVFGNDGRPPAQVLLNVTAAQVERLPDLPVLRGAVTELAQRGIKGTVETEKGRLVDADQEAPQIQSGPVTRRQVAELVTWYRQALAQRRFDSTRGIGGVVESIKGKPIANTAFTTVGEILFPTEVRRIIQERRPKTIVLIPDGALHNLPFEALLISAGDNPRFVLDEFPPIAYVPSASILASLRQRPAVMENQRRLLTVGPEYGRAVRVVATKTTEPVAGNLVAQAELTRDLFEDSAGVLPELKGAQRECERLESTFKQRGLDVVRLLGNDATETRFTASVRGQGIIHLAAHGLVDEQYGNLFGRIALTHSPADADDGFLMYNEILNLPLSGCELAVLSACQTNVGPNRPLEAGSTLAQAFLAAGARRVVASQWSVSDNSTTELVVTFLESVADSLRDSRPPSFAASLHQAKLKVRRDPRWSAPYFWAPFVLLGPNE